MRIYRDPGLTRICFGCTTFWLVIYFFRTGFSIGNGRWYFARKWKRGAMFPLLNGQVIRVVEFEDGSKIATNA